MFDKIIEILEKVIVSIMNYYRARPLSLREKQASLTLGYDILLWSSFYRAGVTTKPELWEEKGVIELSLLEARIEEKLGILDMQIDFPPESSPSPEEAILLFRKYDPLIKSKLAKKKEELVRLYDYGFTLGTIVISLVAGMASGMPRSGGNLSKISNILVDQGKKINLPRNLIEKSQQLQQEVESASISPERAEYFLSQYKKLINQAKDSLSS